MFMATRTGHPGAVRSAAGPGPGHRRDRSRRCRRNGSAEDGSPEERGGEGRPRQHPAQQVQREIVDRHPQDVAEGQRVDAGDHEGAAVEAAGQAIKEMCKRAAAEWGIDAEAVEWKDGAVVKAVLRSTLGGNLRIRVPNQMRSTNGTAFKNAVGENPNPFYATETIKEPVVSEKATMVAEKNEQVIFQVARDANKLDVKQAVELLFKVQVESVQIVNQKGKPKRFGRFEGRRDHAKKAYVNLKPGQEINFEAEAN